VVGTGYVTFQNSRPRISKVTRPILSPSSTEHGIDTTAPPEDYGIATRGVALDVTLAVRRDTLGISVFVFTRKRTPYSRQAENDLAKTRCCIATLARVSVVP